MEEKGKIISVSQLPHAGLGNKLFVWAQGLIFANINNCAYLTFGWAHLHIRTLMKKVLKMEKRHEYYLNPFKSQASLFNLVYYFINKNQIIQLSQIECNKKRENGIYLFSRMHDNQDLFVVIKDYRELIIDNFFNLLQPKLLNELSKTCYPIIGVHIRRGDFVSMNWSTPTSYFKEVIVTLRKYIGYILPVTIFTDADPQEEELQEILGLEQVNIAPEAAAIVHMAMLSKSKIIVMSNNSTFSQWAAFLSEAIVINHPSYTGAKIRCKDFNNLVYEGIIPPTNFEDWPEVLIKNLCSIRRDFKSI